MKYIILIPIMAIFMGCGSDDSSKSKNADKGFNLNDYPKTTFLSTETKKTLAYMANEERLAYDLYTTLHKTYQNITQLQNIATKSETKHIEVAKQLIQRYGITGDDLEDADYNTLNYQNLPLEQMQTGKYGVTAIQDLYNSLLAEGSISDIDALKVACKVEVVDVNDLNTKIAQAREDQAEDIVAAFEFLRKGSYKHYWAFDKALKSKGVTDGCILDDDVYNDKSDIYPK